MGGLNRVKKLVQPAHSCFFRGVNGAVLCENARMFSLSAPKRATFSLLKLFYIWLNIGLTSFGGGAATQALIYQHFVTRQAWIEPNAFAQMWAIVQFAPGINLIAMAILIGNTLGGAAGVLVSLVGMLLPSAGITVAMTAAYVSVREQPAAQKVLRGITPALVGMSVAMMWRFLGAAVSSLRGRGAGSIGFGMAIVFATMALTLLRVPVLVSYLVGALALGVAYGVWGKRLPKAGV